MVSPSFAGSSSPGARIVNYYEDPGARPHPNPGERLYVFGLEAALAPVPGVAQRAAVVYLPSPADGRAYTASLRSYYACE
eukprot:12416595-Alexandrium_andersonii.AAC.1